MKHLLLFETKIFQFQVQSAAQHKYLYEAVADYARRVQRGEKPMDNEEQTLLSGDNGDAYDDYVLED